MKSGFFGPVRAFEQRRLYRKGVAEAANLIRHACKQVDRIPFDPWACAHYMGVPVYSSGLPESIAGCLHFGHEGPHIEVRRGDSRTRQRFTLCHELAHLALLNCDVHSAIGDRFRMSAERRHAREERLCNRIASELLMPVIPFSRRATELYKRLSGNPGTRQLEELADAFGTSLAATSIRLKALRLWEGRVPWVRERSLHQAPPVPPVADHQFSHIKSFNDIKEFLTAIGCS